MMQKSAIIIGTIGLCFLGRSFASTPTQSTLPSLTQVAPFKLSVTALPTAEFDEENIPDDLDFTANELELLGVFAATDLANAKLIFGAEFRYTQYNFDSDDADNNELYELNLPITYITASNRWTHVARVAPGIHTDFEEVDSEDFTVTALYQATYKSSDQLSWVMGAGVNHQFGEAQAFPIVGAIYRPTDKLLLNLVLPQLEAIYIAKESWLWHLSLAPTGRSWNVQDETSEKDVDIVTSEFRVSAGTTFAINDTLAIRGTVGSVMNRNLEFTLDSGEAVDLDVEDGSFVSLALEMRL